MKEQLRIEAEKVLRQKGMNCEKLRNTYTLDGNDDSFLDRIINAMLDFHAQQSKERDDQHAIAFAQWMHENTVYSGNGFYTSFIPKHNNCQFKLVQLIKLYNQSL